MKKSPAWKTRGQDGVVARMKSNKVINGDVLLYAVEPAEATWTS
jgi:hypothetical protein